MDAPMRPYTIPAKQPKYVSGALEFMHEQTGENTASVAMWITDHWDEYHATGKPRKKREPKAKAGGDGGGAVGEEHELGGGAHDQVAVKQEDDEPEKKRKTSSSGGGRSRRRRQLAEQMHQVYERVQGELAHRGLPPDDPIFQMVDEFYGLAEEVAETSDSAPPTPAQ